MNSGRGSELIFLLNSDPLPEFIFFLRVLGLYAIVNNAGINKFGKFEWITIEDMQNVMDVNFWGMVRITKAMLPMLKTAKGRIVQ